MIAWFKGLLVNTRVRQTGMLYLAMLTSLVVSIGVSAVNTRLLGPSGYGDYRFILNLFSLAISILSMGLFVSGARMIALEGASSRRRQLFGAQGVIVAILWIAIMAIFFVLAEYQERWFDNDLGEVIKLVLPLVVTYPLRQCLDNLLKGDNRIASLSLIRTLPGLLYLVVVLPLSAYRDIHLADVLIIFMATKLAVEVIAYLRLRPSLTKTKEWIGNILKETKVYGFPVYLGMLAGTATTQMAGVTLAYYMDNVAVGYFMLATTVAMPLTMISSVVGTVFFKSFASQSRIPRKVLVVTLTASTMSYVAFVVLLKPLVSLIYTEQFLPVVDIAYIVAVGSVVQGVSDLINSFVCAQGGGVMARNAAYARGAVNIIGYTWLVSEIGIYGAAITPVIAAMVQMIFISYYYKKLTLDSMAY